MKCKLFFWIFFIAFGLGYGVSLQSCNDNPYVQGEILYQNFCANCHMENGQGLKGLIPPLAGADYLKNNQNDVACIIRHGMTGVVTVNGKEYSQAMQPIPELSDFEIANVINFINQAWGNDFGFVKINDVRRSLENCKNK